jgi:hypothetical protein
MTGPTWAGRQHRALPFYTLFEERAKPWLPANVPKAPPPAPCEPQPRFKMAACPWASECATRRVQCKAFEMYVGGATPMSVQLKNRGYRRRPLVDNPKD